MTIVLKSKPGISSTTTLHIPKDWDPTWFRNFISNQLKGADVRNAIAGAGISITGNISTPYATISATGGAPAGATDSVQYNNGGAFGGITSTGNAGYVLTENASGPPSFQAASGGAANITPDTHPASPNAVNDEFEEASLSSQWTQAYNQTQTTYVLTSGMLTFTTSTGALIQPTVIYQSIVGTTWEIRCKLVGCDSGAFAGLFAGQNVATAPGGYAEGILFGWLANTVVGYGASAGGGGTLVTAQAMGNTYNYQSNVLSAVNLYLDMSYNGTTLNCSVSLDGVNFSTVGSASFASYGGTPTVFGLFSATAGGIAFGSFDWFRRIA
jgi:hypothetical protein